MTGMCGATILASISHMLTPSVLLRPLGPGDDAAERAQPDPKALDHGPGGCAPGPTSGAGFPEFASWIVVRRPSRPFRLRERTAGWTIRRRRLMRPRHSGAASLCSRSPIYVFTIPILAFTMSDLGVHVAPIHAFTID